MTRRHPTLLALAVTAALGGTVTWAAPASTRPATTRPAADRLASSRPSASTAEAAAATPDTTPKPMAVAFVPLLRRSIFVKGSQTIRPAGDTGGLGAGTVKPPTPASPESTLVFTGVILSGDHSDALIEDTAGRKVFTVKAGDPIATGRVTGITFDDLTYQPAGRAGVHIQVGQTFEGKAAAPTDTVPSADGGPAPVTPGAAGPGTPSTLGVTSGMSADDILARMKKRREQEKAAGR